VRHRKASPRLQATTAGKGFGTATEELFDPISHSNDLQNTSLIIKVAECVRRRRADYKPYRPTELRGVLHQERI
jgi:hypothetical protein